MRAYIFVAALALTLCAWTCIATAQDPHAVALAGPAQDATAFQSSIEARAEAAIRQVACGYETRFHLLVSALDWKPPSTGDASRDAEKLWVDWRDPGEDLTSILVAKAAWLLRHTDWAQDDPDAAFRTATCELSHAVFVVSNHEVSAGQFALADPSAIDYSRFGAACNHDGARVLFAVAPYHEGEVHDASVRLSGACLRAQINYVLQRSRWVQRTQLGSSDLPCFLVEGKTRGEWDVNVRDFIRVLFFDERARQAGAASDGRPTLLDTDVRDYLRDQLISVSGPPLPAESYSALECGNAERSTGTPEQIGVSQSQDSWLEGALDDVWEGAKWLLIRLLLILALAIAAGVAGLAVLAIPPLIVPFAIAVGSGALAAFVSFARIPETENHLLMIESSRYLKNQVLIDYYVAHEDHAYARGFEPHQAALKSWLLERMRGVIRDDFEEYNAIPYQRYSLTALMNLADFARDADVREAATMVLDRQMAKFAVSSSEGRRFAPFRRRMEKLAGFDRPVQDDHLAGGALSPLSNYDFVASLALLHFGHVRHLPQGNAHVSAAMTLMYGAVSDYRPPDLILQLGIFPPDEVWFHEFSHDGLERYTKGKGFLLAAGGKEASYANTIELLGLSTPLGDANDRGAAWPTTLIITGGPQRDRLWEFLRIVGRRRSHGSVYSYDDNVRLSGGFASGRDIRLPGSVRSCLVDGPAAGPLRWRFFSSVGCSTYSGAAPVHVAMLTDRADDLPYGVDDVALGNGLVEVVDAGAPTAADFDAFRAAVVADNPGLVALANATYKTRGGATIHFDGDGEAVIPDAYKGVRGPVMYSTMDGYMEIHDPRGGPTLVLDFRNAASPHRTWQ